MERTMASKRIVRREASGQGLLPGLGRTPKMENHPLSPVVAHRDAGHYFDTRHDGIVNRFKLTDAIKHWNNTRDSEGEWSHPKTNEGRYKVLTGAINKHLGLTQDQVQAARENREFRDVTNVTVLSMLKQAEFMLATTIMNSVESGRMTHQEIHQSFTLMLKRIAPPMASIIKLAKDLNG